MVNFWQCGFANCFIILTNQLLAMIKFRDRPFYHLNINKLIEPLSEKSFPSDHAAVAFAIAVAIYFYNKKLGSILIFCAFLISLARIYGGVHYPLDVIAGAIVGTLFSIVFHKIYKRIK